MARCAGCAHWLRDTRATQHAQRGVQSVRSAVVLRARTAIRVCAGHTQAVVVPQKVAEHQAVVGEDEGEEMEPLREKL